MACHKKCCIKYAAVAILTFINLLNYIDRVTLAGILTQLQKSDQNGFGRPVTDFEGGLLQTAFIISYMLLSPFFGYLGDRYTRKYIIAAGITLWSCFTLVGSFSVNYWMLLATRCLVGVGEASYATIAPTIIADLFLPAERLFMLTVFYIAIPLGSALGYIIGSEVAALVQQMFKVSASWRWALRVTPVCGIISVLLVVIFVTEPARGDSEGHFKAKSVKGKSGIHAYVEDVGYCLANKTFVFSTLGFTAVTFSTGALAQWAPTFVVRISTIVESGHQYNQQTAALIFGGITVLAGLMGTVFGSGMSKFLSRWTRKSDALVCSVSMLLGGPFLFLALLLARYELYAAWFLVFVAEFFLFLNWAPVAAMLLYSIVPFRRSTAEAIQILSSHLLGDAISPTIIGAMSDSLYHYLNAPTEDEGRGLSMQFSLYITSVICVLGGAAFLVSTLTVDRDREAVDKFVRTSGLERSASINASDGEFDEHRSLLVNSLKN